MASTLSLSALQATYAFCICYAVVSDFSSLRIPNWIPLALTGAFAVVAVLDIDQAALLARVGLAAVAFLLGFAFFAANWLGGGDVKLLAAIVLWTGLESTAEFVVLMAAIGGVMALVLILVRSHSLLFFGVAQRVWLVRRLVELGERGQCPYGVAIGLAALLTGNTLIWPS
jgi:prepilin peptidase CpaA